MKKCSSSGGSGNGQQRSDHTNNFKVKTLQLFGIWRWLCTKWKYAWIREKKKKTRAKYTHRRNNPRKIICYPFSRICIGRAVQWKTGKMAFRHLLLYCWIVWFLFPSRALFLSVFFLSLSSYLLKFVLRVLTLSPDWYLVCLFYRRTLNWIFAIWIYTAVVLFMCALIWNRFKCSLQAISMGRHKKRKESGKATQSQAGLAVVFLSALLFWACAVAYSWAMRMSVSCSLFTKFYARDFAI